VTLIERVQRHADKNFAPASFFWVYTITWPDDGHTSRPSCLYSTAQAVCDELAAQYGNLTDKPVPFAWKIGTHGAELTAHLYNMDFTVYPIIVATPREAKP
jgi:hypothetical protein